MNKVKNRGITLVALIITIIILLILAGITISQLTGSGLFEKAQLAEQESKNAQEKEEGILADYENKIGQYVDGSRDYQSEINDLKSEIATLKTEIALFKTQNTMSETEHFTGDYYFNGKPIYAKTIYIESLPNSAQKSYNHNIENVDQIWYDTSKCFGIWKDGTVASLPYITNYTDNIIWLMGLSTSSISILTDKDRSAIQAYITLNYTKTTDTGNGTTIPATPETN